MWQLSDITLFLNQSYYMKDAHTTSRDAQIECFFSHTHCLFIYLFVPQIERRASGTLWMYSATMLRSYLLTFILFCPEMCILTWTENNKSVSNERTNLEASISDFKMCYEAALVLPLKQSYGSMD